MGWRAGVEGREVRWRRRMRGDTGGGPLVGWSKKGGWWMLNAGCCTDADQGPRRGRGRGGRGGGTGTMPARRRGRGAWDNQKDSASAAGGPRCWAGPVQRLDSSEVGCHWAAGLSCGREFGGGH
ncbi:hypothetical protein K456DRAFT_1756306 [Colletotrichum gloeosporioides 23]|nr:hypothetical protein K456DRAFT_1756306 [Colletotrichum gloeosporioides 23]